MAEMALTELLEKLGLTEYEGKTLSALFRLNEAEAPDVSRMAQVPKTRVYDVLDRLVEKKLVIEIRGRPKKYRVVDAGAALESLVSEQKKQLVRLEEQALSLKNRFLQKERAPLGGEAVLKVKSQGDFEKILAQEISGAETEIVGLTRLSDESSVLLDALKAARGQNVSVKLVNHPGLKLSDHFQSKHVKSHEHGLDAFVIDNKKAILALSDFSAGGEGEKYFAIWHDKPAMARALKHYFDKCWTQGKTN